MSHLNCFCMNEYFLKTSVILAPVAFHKVTEQERPLSILYSTYYSSELQVKKKGRKKEKRTTNKHETASSYLAQAVLQLAVKLVFKLKVILPLQPLECWNCMCELAHHA